MRLARLIIFFSLCITLWQLTTRTVHAEGEFETDYDVTYSIDESGITTATYNITLENKTPNFYADKFELKIGSAKITEVVARDQTGDLATEVKFEDNVTIISTKFSQRVIGINKTLNWTLIYKTDEIAIKSGQIWEVSIPKIANSKDTGAYDLEVLVPKSLGPSAYAIPQPVKQEETSRDYIFNFKKDQVILSGVALGFGEKQVFSLNLKYYLENASITSQTLSVALPPDNNYQKIVLTKIEPKPIDVIVDTDGNFLAQYKLKPKEKLEVSVLGDVEVFSKPFRKIVKSLSKDEKETYLQPQSYWEVDNTAIREKAQELKTPQAIYEFTTSTLKYNSERLTRGVLERKGAISALNDPTDSVCMEFTDLFIALSRAAGIPAREIEGYAYTQNDRLRPLSLSLYEGDILHAWPEYWDEEDGWVQVDPTWAATSGGLDYLNKMDFNHVTFVQRGRSSTQPHPAGAYKTKDDKDQKTVFVQFSQELPNTTPAAQIQVDIPKRAISSIPLKIKATVVNAASTSIVGEKLNLRIDLNEAVAKEEEIPILPPFSKKTYEFNFQTRGLLSTQKATLVAAYYGVNISKAVAIEPFYMLVTDPVFIIALALTTAVIALGLIFYKKHNSFPKIRFKKSPYHS